MSLPKEPRQLMINLMYLVLTALLAMNVSSEILNAFKTIGKSIQRSNTAQSEHNSNITNAFDKFLKDDNANAEKKAKVLKAQELAAQVNAKTEALVAQLETYKKQIVTASGGYDAEGQIKRIDDLDAGTRVMVEEGNGKKMLDGMKAYKDEIAGLVPLGWDDMTPAGTGNNPDVFKNLPLSFDIEENEENVNKDWSYYNFHMSPTIANVTLIDKYISDIRGSQSVALSEIWSKATGDPMDREETKLQDYTEIKTKAQTFNKYDVIVSADNNYVLPGERFKARIMLGTYNPNKANLSFSVNGSNVQVKDGVGYYETTAPTTPGPIPLRVEARFLDTADGLSKATTMRTVALKEPYKYYVGEAQASISLDKMNVFYMGVDNPITIAASGIQAGNISFNAENCTLTKAAGLNQYIVRPTKAGVMAKITVNGKLPDGVTTKTFGPFNYRVKNIPDPYPVVAGKKGGQACANELKAQQAIFAKLDAFDFDVKFEVISFEIFYTPKRGESKAGAGRGFYLSGPNADPSVRDIMSELKVGGKLYFDNIRVKMPDGRIRNVGSLMFNINC